MVYSFFDKHTAGGAVNKDLPEELQKSIIRKFEKRKTFIFYR